MSVKFNIGDRLIYTPDDDIAEVVSENSFVWITFLGEYNHRYIG